ncbi:universal stress protein [Halomicroarcula limicola]|uniref:Universal stress protein n=1 Tax=Haloarcula limicola TaxID=1429915 RepID=A0A8J7YDE2_9EURY|nr:universal stress protein [Halomicroarcula limicola]MBV0926199.1 universal stress protein [Halomicroarcula limicola]
MYEHILIPFDGSDEARKGARHAIELAAELGSTAHGLYVIDLPGVPRAMSLRDDEEDLREEYQAYGEEVLSELGDIAADHGVEYEWTIRSGTPSEEIVDYADEDGMDVIVLGSAYRGKLGNLLGGTTDKVVRSATVPVITERMAMDEV